MFIDEIATKIGDFMILPINYECDIRALTGNVNLRFGLQTCTA